MRYDAVIFDLFGTLIDSLSRREYERVLAEMAGVLGIPCGDFVRLWLATSYERAVGILASSEANIAHCYRALGREGGPAGVADAVEIRTRFTQRALVPRPGSTETLLALRAAGYRLGLISDCSSEVSLLWSGTPFAPLFDEALFSCAVGLKKPDPRIYQLACDRLGVPPERCLYVGDGGSRELSGAAAVGMRPVLLRAAHEDASDAHRIDAEDWDGPTIAALPDVLALVEDGAAGTPIARGAGNAVSPAIQAAQGAP